LATKIYWYRLELAGHAHYVWERERLTFDKALLALAALLTIIPEANRWGQIELVGEGMRDD